MWKLEAMVNARRKHHGELLEAIHVLYRRYGKDDADVMNAWSLVVVDPEPLTDEEIARARELFPEHFPPQSSQTTKESP
jgi:hypothetical protein